MPLEMIFDHLSDRDDPFGDLLILVDDGVHHVDSIGEPMEDLGFFPFLSLHIFRCFLEKDEEFLDGGVQGLHCIHICFRSLLPAFSPEFLKLFLQVDQVLMGHDLIVFGFR